MCHAEWSGLYDLSCSTLSKLDQCLSNTAIMWTPVFELYMVGCGFKNKQLIGDWADAQNLSTILGSIVNIIGGTYMTIQ